MNIANGYAQTIVFFMVFMKDDLFLKTILFKAKMNNAIRVIMNKNAKISNKLLKK